MALVTLGSGLAIGSMFRDPTLSVLASSIYMGK
jgi:hypothetical protein